MTRAKSRLLLCFEQRIALEPIMSTKLTIYSDFI